jgi:chromosome segregation ATPase
MPSVSVPAGSVVEAEVVADSGLSSRADDIGLALFSTSVINEIKGEVATLRAENAQMKESIRTMSAGFNKLDTTLAAARESIYIDNITIKELTSKSNELLWQNTILLNQLKELVAQMVDTPTDEHEDSPSVMSE